MKKNIISVLLTAFTFVGASSFADETSAKAVQSMTVLVYAAKCEEVHGDPKVVRLSWREGNQYILKASDFSDGTLTKTETSEMGTLTTHFKLEQFDAQNSIKIFSRYTSKDHTEKGNLYIREYFGTSLNVESGACEAPEDVGNISIKITTTNKG